MGLKCCENKAGPQDGKSGADTEGQESSEQRQIYQAELAHDFHRRPTIPH
jgi:hypothetical protein